MTPICVKNLLICRRRTSIKRSCVTNFYLYDFIWLFLKHKFSEPEFVGLLGLTGGYALPLLCLFTNNCSGDSRLQFYSSSNACHNIQY